MPDSLAKRFRELRVDTGLSGAALASPRYTLSYVSQIEAGRRRPSPEALAFFADRLGVTSRFLVTGVPEHLEPELRYRLEECRQAVREGRPDAAEALGRAVVGEASEAGLERLAAQGRVALGEALVLQSRL